MTLEHAPASIESADDDDIELVIMLARDPDWSLLEIAELLALDPVLVIEILYTHRDCFFEEEEGSLH